MISCSGDGASRLRVKCELKMEEEMATPAAELSRKALAGQVERVRFHNSETGFCVLHTKVRSERDLVSVVGHVAAINAGTFV